MPKPEALKKYLRRDLGDGYINYKHEGNNYLEFLQDILKCFLKFKDE
jgi:hypothetical protein